MSNGFLIIISGPSGVGKGTIIEEVRKKIPELLFSTSVTTRPPRPNEKDGVQYHFITENEFKKGIAENRFLEWANVHGNYYGTPRSFIEENLTKGLEIILDIDVQGALSVKKIYPDAVYIFILPPDFDELKKRLTGRSTENSAAIAHRLKDAEEELRHLDAYPYHITNDSLSQAVSKIIEIIRNERKKRS